MRIEDAVVLVDNATEKQIQEENDKHLSLIYNHYVVMYYLGGDGDTLTPATFMDFWKTLSLKEKEHFIRSIVI